MENKKDKKASNKGIVFAGLGMELAGLVIGSVSLGQKLDEIYGWQGYGVAGLTVLSMIGWLIHLIYMLKRWQENG